MSVTGLLLIGFLVVHLAGNLQLFSDDTGEHFNAYAEKLKSFGPLLYVAEFGLIALFVAHLALGLRVTFENRAARSQRYALDRDRGARSFASSTMVVTGVIVLVFVIVHLLDFRLREMAPDGLAAMVVRRLSEPAGALIYIVGVGALGIHLSHAFRSAMQTLGLNNTRYDVPIARAGKALAIVLGVGFAIFPLVYFSGAKGSTHSASVRAAEPGATEDVYFLGKGGASLRGFEFRGVGAIEPSHLDDVGDPRSIGREEQR
ncbi:MAG: succinate dehydrogenase cytochrome b subunit [Planctomycetes bacterium]|nr:succinate dehydrogenase cytochrome b subunit [Planctomycetota bacterium]